MNSLKRINKAWFACLIGLIFLSLSISVAYAYEDFTVNMLQDTAFCSCSSKVNPIVITNTGNEASLYQINLKNGGLSKWISIAPFTFTLNPGESKEIFENIAPSCNTEKGAYNQAIEVNTATITKQYVQNIQLQSCLNVNIEPINYQQTICPCTTAKYDLKVSNPGSYTEYYNLKIDSFGEYSTISENPIILDGGQAKILSLYITPKCDMTGSYTINVSAEAQQSKLSAKMPIYLKIDNCYDYTANLGQKFVVGDQINPTMDFIPQEETSYNICEGEKSLIPIEISNPGPINENYGLKLTSPYSWIRLAERNISVMSGRNNFAFIIINNSFRTEMPTQLGISIDSDSGKIHKDLGISVIPKNCYMPEIGKKDNSIAIRYNNMATYLPLKNTGISTAAYEISLITDQGWITLGERFVTLSPGETKKITVLTNPSNATQEKNYPIRINVKTNSGYTYSKEFDVKLIKETPAEKIANLAILYWRYLAAALIILILLILIIIFGKSFAAKRKSQIQREKEQKKQVEEKLKMQMQKDMKKEANALKKEMSLFEKEIRKELKKESKKEALPKIIKEKPAAEKPKEKKYVEIWPFVLIIIIAIVSATLYYIFSGYPIPNLGNQTATTLSTTPSLQNNLNSMIGAALSFIFAYKWYILSAIIALIIIFVVISVMHSRTEKKKEGRTEKEDKKAAKKKEEAEKKAEKQILKRAEKKSEIKTNHPEEKSKKEKRPFWDYLMAAILIILVIIAASAIVLSSLNMWPFSGNQTISTSTTTNAIIPATTTTLPLIINKTTTSTTIITTSTSTTYTATTTTLPKNQSSNETNNASQATSTTKATPVTTIPTTTTLASTSIDNSTLTSTTRLVPGPYQQIITLNKVLIILQKAVIAYSYYIIAAIIALIAIGLIAMSARSNDKKNEASKENEKANERRDTGQEKKRVEKVSRNGDAPESIKKDWAGSIIILILIAAVLIILYLIYREIGISAMLAHTSNVARSAASFIISQSIYIILAILLIIIFFIIRFLARRSRRKRETEASLSSYSTGDDVTIPVNERFGIGELSFRIRKKIIGGKITLRRVKGQPTFIRAAKDVYSYFEIEEEGIDSESLSNILLRFRIRKSWIEHHNINPKSVRIKRYEKREWQELPTKAIDEDDYYAYYETRLSEFSYYAITAERRETKPLQEDVAALAKEKTKRIQEKIANANAEETAALRSELEKLKAEIREIESRRKAEKTMMAAERKESAKAVRKEEIKEEMKEARKAEERKAEKDEDKKKETMWPIYILLILAIIIFASVIYYNSEKLGSMLSITGSIDPSSTAITTTTQSTTTSTIHASTTTTLQASTTTSTAEKYWTDEILAAIDDGRYKYDSKGRVVDTRTKEILNNTQFAELLINSKIDVLEKTNLKLADLDMLVQLLSPGKTVIEKGIPTQVIQMNNQTILNLSQYFFDPDNDILSFNATKTENIAIMLDNNKGLAIMTPRKDFWGHETAVFRANDGKGGFVDSNNVTIIVKKGKSDIKEIIPVSGSNDARGFLASAYNTSYHIMTTYYIYIIAGMILVVLLIVILRFNENLFSFPEEKEIEKEIEKEKEQEQKKENDKENKSHKSQEKRTSHKKDK